MCQKQLALLGYLLVTTFFLIPLTGCTAPAMAPTVNHATTDFQAKKVLASASGIPLHCEVTVLRPAKFAPHRDVIRVFEPAPKYQNTPATIDWGVKRIQVEPARMEHETIPAQYHEVTERIEVLRERTELKGVNAVYKTIDRPVTIRPAHTIWRKDCIPEDGPAACFENIPGESRTLKQQIVATPAKIIQTRLPAEIMEVSRKVLVKQGRGTGRVIPPRYRDIKIGRIERVWKINTQIPEARYESIQVQKTIRPEQLKQVPALCTGSEVSTEIIKRIQLALRKQKTPVRVTGKLDQQSWLALTRYQQRHDLFVGAITAETLKNLGI